MKNSCIDQFDMINCQAAVNFCDSEISSGMWASGEHDSVLDLFLGYETTLLRT